MQAEVGDGDEPEEGVVEEVEEDDEEVPACLVCGILQFLNSWFTATVNKWLGILSCDIWTHAWRTELKLLLKCVSDLGVCYNCCDETF